MNRKNCITKQKEIVFNLFGQLRYRRRFFLKKINRYYRQVNEGL